MKSEHSSQRLAANNQNHDKVEQIQISDDDSKSVKQLDSQNIVIQQQKQYTFRAEFAKNTISLNLRTFELQYFTIKQYKFTLSSTNLPLVPLIYNNLEEFFNASINNDGYDINSKEGILIINYQVFVHNQIADKTYKIKLSQVQINNDTKLIMVAQKLKNIQNKQIRLDESKAQKIAYKKKIKKLQIEKNRLQKLLKQPELVDQFEILRNQWIQTQVDVKSAFIKEFQVDGSIIEYIGQEKEEQTMLLGKYSTKQRNSYIFEIIQAKSACIGFGLIDSSNINDRSPGKNSIQFWGPQCELWKDKKLLSSQTNNAYSEGDTVIMIVDETNIKWIINDVIKQQTDLPLLLNKQIRWVPFMCFDNKRSHKIKWAHKQLSL